MRVNRLWARRPSPAVVVAVVALAVGLGGTSYAAVELSRNSVGAKHIRTGAVAGAEVRDGSLAATDFAPGQLPAGPRGERGAPGEQGDRGPQGERGPSGGLVKFRPPGLFGLPNASSSTQMPRPKEDSILKETSLPPGSYVLTAKLIAIGGFGATQRGTARCVINAAGSQTNFDLTEATVSDDQPSTLFATVAHTSTTPSEVSLSCVAVNGPLFGDYAKLTAIQVGSLENSPGD